MPSECGEGATAVPRGEAHLPNGTLPTPRLLKTKMPFRATRSREGFLR